MNDYVLSDAATRDIRRISRRIRERVFSALDRYVESGIGDIRKLAGRQDEWRLRVGDFRVLFQRNEAEQRIEVLTVRHRREAYRP